MYLSAMPLRLVTVAIPTFDEGRHLPAFLTDVARLGAAVETCAVEFVVVDDGSSPEHLARHREAVQQAAAVLEAAAVPHAFRLLELGRNTGKGAAIRAGWRDASPRSGWLGFVDADGAIPARELWRLIGMLGSVDAEVLAGARIRMAGRRVGRSLVRHLQGRVFATLAERLLPNGFYDTQCGLKFVASGLVVPLLDSFREDRWLFDLELISRVRAAGGRCVEEPIDWTDPGGSKVVPVLDPLKMAWGLWRLRRRLASGAPKSV